MKKKNLNTNARANIIARCVRDHAHTPLHIVRDWFGTVIAFRGEDEVAHRLPGESWEWYESMQFVGDWSECKLSNHHIKHLRDSFGGYLPNLWSEGVTATLCREGETLTVIYTYQDGCDDSYGGSVCWDEYLSYVSNNGGEFHVVSAFEVEDEDLEDLDWSDLD